MRKRVILAGTLLLAAACYGGDEAEPPQAAEPAPAAAIAMPDTTDASLWAHLRDSDYRSWSRWPGTGELYTGQEPHGMLLTTYVNSLALDALMNGSAMMPGGAIVVKENYMPDRTLAAVTVMHKVPGYAPDHADWYWVKYLPGGEVEASGRVPMCQACHAAQAQADYLFTARPQ